MQPLTVLIVEDEPAAREAFAKIAEEKKESLFLVGMTDKVDEALRLIQYHLPEAVIVDVDMGDRKTRACEGLDVLFKLQRTKLTARPFLLAVTALRGPDTKNYTYYLGADIVIDKNEKDYSELRCVDTLLQLQGYIERRYCTKEQREYMHASPEDRERLLTHRAHEELHRVGIKGPRKYGPPTGFDYLTTAILLKIKKPDKYYRDEIAAEQWTSAAAVERAMQRAINRAWRTMDIDTLLDNYHGELARSIPSVSEFVDYYAEKISKDLLIAE